ncbi:uncharacterized protein LOC115231785 [Octopus sinensis]|uniref:Uncharacterized protein LOC115231785 n=1 Tax=Octopus sinensis TaxID=2607531 RepID=A0A7E6EL30_9MOLL|nr:uncharacterized protein LOC115231785 [Octopus sinensis]
MVLCFVHKIVRKCGKCEISSFGLEYLTKQFQLYVSSHRRYVRSLFILCSMSGNLQFLEDDMKTYLINHILNFYCIDFSLGAACLPSNKLPDCFGRIDSLYHEYATIHFNFNKKYSPELKLVALILENGVELCQNDLNVCSQSDMFDSLLNLWGNESLSLPKTDLIASFLDYIEEHYKYEVMDTIPLNSLSIQVECLAKLAKIFDSMTGRLAGVDYSNCCTFAPHYFIWK